MIEGKLKADACPVEMLGLPPMRLTTLKTVYIYNKLLYIRSVAFTNIYKQNKGTPAIKLYGETGEDVNVSKTCTSMHRVAHWKGCTASYLLGYYTFP